MGELWRRVHCNSVRRCDLAGRNCGLPVQNFSVAAIANSFFEGWFLSLVSPLLFHLPLAGGLWLFAAA